MGGPLWRYFRSGSFPWRPKRAGPQQEDQLLIDATEKKGHNRIFSKKTSYQRSSTTGTQKIVCFLLFLLIVRLPKEERSGACLSSLKNSQHLHPLSPLCPSFLPSSSSHV